MIYCEESKLFNIALRSATDNNDAESFKNIMIGSHFSSIDVIEKEKTAFIVAYTASEVCLDYLIFEYNIQKTDIIEAFCGTNEVVKKKFEMREVAKDLPVNNRSTKRSIKV